MKNRIVKIVLTHLLLLSALLSAFSVHSDTLTFYHNDAFGSPIAATDESGNVLWTERREPFGDPKLNQSEKEKHIVDYTGHVYDKELGLHYQGRRFYDPVIGRFMGFDPVGFSPENIQSFNRYAYANNNPYKYRDPNGEAPVIIAVPIVTGIGYLLTSRVANAPTHDSTNQGNSILDLLPAALGGGSVLVGSKLAGGAVAKTGTKGASGTLTTASGKKYSGNSTGSSASGGDPRAPMHPQTQQALDNVKKPSRTHGYCCEIDAINKALNAGESVKGGKMGPVKLNETGRVLPACSTCREVKKTLGVE